MRIFKNIYHRETYTEKTPDNITCFRISAGADFEKWMYQNGAVYTGDYVDGCLLDNFVVCTKRGFAAVYEHYVNCWTSDYYIEFQPGAAQEVFRRWYDFELKTEGIDK